MFALPSRLGRRTARRLVTLGTALVTFALFAVPGARAADVPDTLAALVLHARHRAVTQIDLDGVPFETLRPFSELPYVAWPAASGPAPCARDASSVEAWLARAAAPLGHAQLTARHAGQHDWRGDEVWDFSLSHAGIPVRDAGVEVHWRAERFVGLVNRLPGPIARIEAPPAGLVDPSLVYQPVRGERGVVLALARVVVEEGPSHRTLRTTSLAGELLATLVEPSVHESVEVGSFEFREYAIGAGGAFPDQIDVDSSGTVWFSQPNDELLGSFLPGPERFQRFRIPAPASGPDGMVIDRFDRLWTGLYYAGGLGLLDIPSGQFQHFPAPYPSAAMAIPMVARSGEVWVTDHSQNRISRFDPASSTWTASHVMPTPNAWVTAGAEDTQTQRIYFTEYNANRLALVTADSPPIEFAVPGFGPAFLTVSGRSVYWAQWNVARLGEYDIESQQAVEYAFPELAELGGPLARMPDGNVVVGTRGQGRILIFDVDAKTFASYPIPTALPGLKDGLTVDRSGTIWFTESGVDRIGRLDVD